MGNCCEEEQYKNQETNHCYKSAINKDYKKYRTSKQGIKHIGKSSARAPKLGGLVNIGNTCYMNSGLMCLFHTSMLTNKIVVCCEKQFAKQYKNVYNKISNSQSFQPKKLKILIENYNPQFKGNGQNDAGQLVATVLNLIAEETNVANPSKARPEIENCKSQSDEQLYQRYVNRDDQHCKSLIDRIITGRFKTTYKCNNCSNEERLFENFNLIYLPIPKENKLIKLQDCIKQFQKPQDLSSWDCDECGRDREHTKTMSIYQANKVLIFSLKRFAEGARKNKAYVDIPDQLSLQFKKDKLGLNWKTYQLYSVIKHVGELQSGHYTALCLNQNKQWLHYDDKRVTLISKEMLKQQQRNACIVFYRLKVELNNPQTYSSLVQT